MMFVNYCKMLQGICGGNNIERVTWTLSHSQACHWLGERVELAMIAGHMDIENCTHEYLIKLAVWKQNSTLPPS